MAKRRLVAMAAILFLASSCKTWAPPPTESSAQAVDKNKRAAELIEKAQLKEWCMAWLKNEIPSNYRRILNIIDTELRAGLKNPSYAINSAPVEVQLRINALPTDGERNDARRRYILGASPELDIPAITMTWEQVERAPYDVYCSVQENFMRRLDFYANENVDDENIRVLISLHWMSRFFLTNSSVTDASPLEVLLPPRGRLKDVTLNNQDIGPGKTTRCSPAMNQANVCHIK